MTEDSHSSGKNDWLSSAIERRAGKRRSHDTEASIVVPINLVFKASQKVLSGSQVVERLSRAKALAVRACECRAALGRCDAPKDVCIVLDSPAEALIKEGIARRIELDEALRILDMAEEAGLVHLVIHMKGWEPEAICSCCPCCCQELNALIGHGMKDAVLQSDFIIEKDEARCVDCGRCVEICHFKAHVMLDGQVAYDSTKCFGCGLCVMACPAQVLKLVEKRTDE